jgi:hypothetical protein
MIALSFLVLSIIEKLRCAEFAKVSNLAQLFYNLKHLRVTCMDLWHPYKCCVNGILSLL